MHQLKQCDLCGSSQGLISLYAEKINYGLPWADFVDPENFPHEMGTMLCTHCGWIFKSHGYDANEIDRLYGVKPHAGENIEQTKLGERFQLRGVGVLKTLEPWLLDKKLRILDAGGGGGELMGGLISRGHEVFVLDINERPACVPGVKKIKGTFADWQEDAVDVIILSHVLEHVDRPSQFLSQAKRILQKNGLLFVEVPFELHTPVLRRHIGDYRHLGYFTETTLRAFLVKMGFDCLFSRTAVNEDIAAPIPVIRAVARRKTDRMGESAWTPPRFMTLRSLSSLLNPIPVYSRLKSKFKSRMLSA